MKKNKKLWGGRFAESTDAAVESFTASIHYDHRLAPYDILGSLAHAHMLKKIGIFTGREYRAVKRGLEAIGRDIREGRVRFSTADEDIHMTIEKLLAARIGKAGAKLHTARSRNDQVALDIRMYLKDVTGTIIGRIRDLQKVFIAQAKKYNDVIIPEMTHLQHAQPVTLAHHWLAYVHMFDRDALRLKDGLKRIHVMPLGAGACAGTGIPIDRHLVAKILGFPEIAANSVDAVSDRDFVMEFLSHLAIIAAHMSRASEELILWMTEEFGFICIGDAYCTGSSMMPQKKNPDVLELIRGKTGRVYGALFSLLTTLKGLPLSYNRDMQEDKEPLFDAIDTVESALGLLAGIVSSVSVNKAAFDEKIKCGYLAATDLAEYLVKKGVGFRDAHRTVGRIVGYAIGKDKNFEDLDIEEFRRFSKFFGPDIYRALSPEAVVDSKKSAGGTNTENVKKEILKWERKLDI